MKLRTAAFEDGARIPATHTADGDNRSFDLAWEGVPPGAAELAVIMDDPDAPRPEPWVHWVVYGIQPEAGRLPAGLPRQERLPRPIGAMQGRNSWQRDNIGYRGPAPPEGRGMHRYRIRLLALDEPLDLDPGADAATLARAARGHILAEAELRGVYSR